MSTSNAPSPLALIQLPRWKVTRLIEMIQRQYSAGELEAEVTGWLAQGVDRLPQSFNLAEATLRAIHARGQDGHTLNEMLPRGLDGRLTGPMRDILETSIYAALAPHIDQLQPPPPLRSVQESLPLGDSLQKPVTEQATDA